MKNVGVASKTFSLFFLGREGERIWQPQKSLLADYVIKSHEKSLIQVPNRFLKWAPFRSIMPKNEVLWDKKQAAVWIIMSFKGTTSSIFKSLICIFSINFALQLLWFFFYPIKILIDYDLISHWKTFSAIANSKCKIKPVRIISFFIRTLYLYYCNSFCVLILWGYFRNLRPENNFTIHVPYRKTLCQAILNVLQWCYKLKNYWIILSFAC